MSIVGDLREALQDVVAPDLKAVVRGLTDLREEVREGNALLRREIEQVRHEARENTAILREDVRQNFALLREESNAIEARHTERLQHLNDSLKLSLVTQRNAELEKQLEQLRSAQQPQQH